HQNHPGFRIVGSSILMVLMVIAIIQILSTAFDDAMIRLLGVETQATIVRKWMEAGVPPGDDQYFVFFEYDAAQQHFQREQHVSLSTFTRLKEGDLVAIRYLRTAPEAATLGDATLDPPSAFMLILCIIFAIICIANLRLGLHLLGTERRFNEHGSVLYGRIIQTRGAKNGNDWHGAEIQYQFVSPRGKTIISSAYKTSVPLKKQDIPPVGTKIAVLYVNDQLFHIL
ncbi:MAG: hypothetical protein K8I30_14825, partial [Anaerolineae bacterium]|nr:hypothetical protein [Anaerolineae bacterium]